MASRSTFDRFEVFHQAVRRAKKIHPILMLVGNKADMADEREVSKEEGAALARQLGCEFGLYEPRRRITTNEKPRTGICI
jgi:GTPase KRas protein